MSVPLETVVQVLDKVADSYYELCDNAIPRMQLQITNRGGEEMYVPRSLTLSATDLAQSVHTTIS
jgi:hypothetical protein